MKRSAIAALILIGVLALGGAASSPSVGAEFCAKPKAGEPSAFRNYLCTIPEMGGGYALIVVPPAPLSLGNDVYCAKVKAGETATWTNNLCNNLVGTKEYIKIVAVPLAKTALAGESYPIHLQGELAKAKTSLGTASGVLLEGEGASLSLTIKATTSLGEFTASLQKVVVPKTAEQCNTAGDAAGVVLLSGKFQVAETVSGLGIVFSPKEVTITCGKLETVVKGLVISSLEAGKESEELTTVTTTLLGASGKQKITEYYNENGEAKKATLLSNSGAGFVQSDENISEPLKLTVSESKMIEIINR